MPNAILNERKKRVSKMRGVLAVVMICAVQLLSAQIQIIPREKLLEAAEPKIAPSTLRFVADRVDFGTIEEMSGVWQGGAKLVNSGTDTVVITRLKSTCGCLKAEVAKKVLAPNEEVELSLKYYPRGHAGRVMQRVFVYTNISDTNPSALLRLQGQVTASADRSDDYPYSRGVLRLRQEMVKFEGSGRQVLRIACMNGGTTAIKPRVEEAFLPKGMSVRFEPIEFAPKEEGDMIVEYAPQENIEDKKSFRIYINGLGTSPRQSVVEVVVEP